MGSQVNFYMVCEDEDHFCRFILSDPDVEIITGMHHGSRFIPVSLPLPSTDVPYAWSLALWNRCVLSREDIQNCNNHFIEFSRSVNNREGLAPGRIWGETDSSGLDAARKKLFREWFRRVAGYRNSLPYRWDMYRICPHTKAYFDAGEKGIGCAMGDVKSIARTGDVTVVRRKPKVIIQRPEIEEDGGTSDLTIEM